MTEMQWFYSFMPFQHHSGPLCDAYLFKLGDLFTKFLSGLSSQLLHQTWGNLACSIQELPSLCVSSIYVNRGLHTWTINITVMISCKTNHYCKDIILQRLSAQPVLATHGNCSIQWWFLGCSAGHDVCTCAIQFMDCRYLWPYCYGILLALIDFEVRTFRALISSNYTTPMIISAQANFDTCPMSVGEMALCSLTVLHLTIVYASVVYPNSSILMYNGHLPINTSVNSWVLDDIFKQPLYSLLQAVDTCIGVKLGNPRPNNFILNPSFLNNIRKTAGLSLASLSLGRCLWCLLLWKIHLWDIFAWDECL